MNQSELLAAGIAQIPARIIDLIARGALFVINHSAGKDSQAMYLMLRDLVPDAQRVIVHADLGAVEWPEAVEHITATTADKSMMNCKSRRHLLDVARERGMFPSPANRCCTSDLKRGVKANFQGAVQGVAHMIIFANLPLNKSLEFAIAQHSPIVFCHQKVVLSRAKPGASCAQRFRKLSRQRDKWNGLSRSPNFDCLNLLMKVYIVSVVQILRKISKDFTCIAQSVCRGFNLLHKAGRSYLGQHVFLSTPISTLGGSKPNRANQRADRAYSTNPICPFCDADFCPRNCVAQKKIHFKCYGNNANYRQKPPFKGQAFVGRQHWLPIYKFLRNHRFSGINWRNHNTQNIGGGK